MPGKGPRQIQDGGYFQRPCFGGDTRSGSSMRAAPDRLVTFDFLSWVMDVWVCVLLWSASVRIWKISMWKISQLNKKIKTWNNEEVITQVIKAQHIQALKHTRSGMNSSVYTPKSSDRGWVTVSQAFLCSVTVFTISVPGHTSLPYAVFGIWQTFCLWLSLADFSECLAFICFPAATGSMLMPCTSQCSSVWVIMHLCGQWFD